MEECQDKLEPTDEDNSMLPSFAHATSKRRWKKQSTKHRKQSKGYITNDQYEELLEQRKAHIVPGKRTYSEVIKIGKI